MELQRKHIMFSEDVFVCVHDNYYIWLDYIFLFNTNLFEKYRINYFKKYEAAGTYMIYMNCVKSRLYITKHYENAVEWMY